MASENGKAPVDWTRVVFQFGVPTLIAFYLLGMIPFLPSPFFQIQQELKAAANAMDAHERTAREQLRVSRHICRGIWRNDPVGQSACGRVHENGHSP